MLVIKIAEPLNAKLSGTPSLRNLKLSVFQHMRLFFLLSSAALRMFRLSSSLNMLSQSSNTITLSLSAILYNLQYKPIALIAPLTTSYFGCLPSAAIALIKSCLPSTFSTPCDLPTPGGPLTIMARTLPFLVALVISSNISKRSRSLSIVSSSVSLACTGFADPASSKHASCDTAILMLRSGKPLLSRASTVM